LLTVKIDRLEVSYQIAPILHAHYNFGKIRGEHDLGLTGDYRLEFPLLEEDVQNLDDPVHALFETNLLVKAARESGLSTERILAESQILPEQLANPQIRVSSRQRLQVYRNIHEHCTDPTVFLRAGSSATVCSFGIWGYVLLSSSTLMDAIRIAFKYLRLTGPLLQKRFDIEDGLAHYEADDVLALGPMLEPVIEFWFSLIHQLSKEITQRSFEAELVELRYPQPVHGSHYAQYFDCDVRFDQTHNRLRFRPEILEMNLPRADALAFQICDEMCSTLIREMQHSTGPAKKVHDLLVRAPNPFPSLDEVAGQMYTTPRTLRRKLADQGTSYQKILNDLRKNLAIKFLRETSLSMEEIAERVGFSDSRNFRHAFKKWTDSTPSSHRVRH
jgi:AraC-like DNA-binding protein